MLCDECKKNEATFHSLKKINGVTTVKHLCSECQKKYGGFKAVKLSGLSDFFSNLTGLFEEPEQEEAICSSCGTSAEEFLRSGFVGCSDCYRELSAVILPVIRKMQGDTSHVGKVPLSLAGSVSTEYERLKKELNEAIAVENYEQASIIRDRMRQIKGDN